MYAPLAHTYKTMSDVICSGNIYYKMPGVHEQGFKFACKYRLDLRPARIQYYGLSAG